jgi:hypothetical protein
MSNVIQVMVTIATPKRYSRLKPKYQYIPTKEARPSNPVEMEVHRIAPSKRLAWPKAAPEKRNAMHSIK